VVVLLGSGATYFLMEMSRFAQRLRADYDRAWAFHVRAMASDLGCPASLLKVQTISGDMYNKGVWVATGCGRSGIYRLRTHSAEPPVVRIPSPPSSSAP